MSLVKGAACTKQLEVCSLWVERKGQRDKRSGSESRGVAKHPRSTDGFVLGVLTSGKQPNTVLFTSPCRLGSYVPATTMCIASWRLHGAKVWGESVADARRAGHSVSASLVGLDELLGQPVGAPPSCMAST